MRNYYKTLISINIELIHNIKNMFRQDKSLKNTREYNDR